MVYGLKTSAAGVVHTAECRHIAGRAAKTLIAYETLAAALQDGRRFCRHCNPVLLAYGRERAAFDRLCAENGCRCKIGRMSIDLFTPGGAWKVAVGEENRLALYHKNTEWRPADIHSPIRGYHLQDCKTQQLVSMLKYILAHDRFRAAHPYQAQEPPAPKPRKQPPVNGRKAPRLSKRNRKKKEKQQHKRERRAMIRCVLDAIEALEQGERATA